MAFSDATLPVRSAFVAGADSGNLYEYEEPVTEDDGLVAPDGQPIVNVSFCYITDDSAGGAESGSPAAESGTAAEASGDGTPPPTDTAGAAAAPTGGSVMLVALGIVAFAAGMLLFARQRLAAQPVRKTEDRQLPRIR